MRLKEKILLSLFLLTLFVSYQVSITVFTHVHYINGVMVVHSHPSKDKQHTHSASQIIVISQLSHFQTPKVEVSDEQIVERPLLYSVVYTYQVPSIEGTHLKNLTLRAPPVNG